MGDATTAVATLTGLDYVYLVGVMAGFLGAIKVLSGLWDWFIAKTGITTKKHEQKIKDLETLKKHDADIKDLKQHEAAIEATIQKIQETVNGLDTKIDEMKERDDNSQRARLKDRIGECYRIYHERKEWTSMEKEAFEDLIKTYELHGGTNSFVHKTCEPESYTWRIKD